MCGGHEKVIHSGLTSRPSPEGCISAFGDKMEEKILLFAAKEPITTLVCPIFDNFGQ